ncbi:MAG: hypothetical protein COT92_02070 [Candidatus Doudnabacteria bacterium CG10_big_fil_rev_8_21_14_0_10_42_18]|uniref:Amidohydrolase-related domain-containing protein n=1 Tax=Candidatus Doudnabacteria bacterium CG10_big_fil_rev_8_21_14_0_10_42_18 TaxID=1974552 RepID=A0A2H0VAZ1_9BACT|nr:MAG: hypothetical protein COT92_02070 [Candidatus Doudnabacteria bacterium CG10_big_fil_rev_8_21_14_0_10_42_18]
MYNLLIKNGKVIDGTGKNGEILDIAVEGDKIVNIAPNISVKAGNTIDAKEKIVAPGFVDIQNHSDSYWQIFDNPSLHSLTSQGFTTILTGNCGGSLAPLFSSEALLSIQKWHDLSGANINWQTFSEYLNELSKKSIACNVASLAGYSTLRRGVVGDQVRSLEKQEMELLNRTLEESLDAGAFGLSSGLSYSHEIIISELELFHLARTLKKNKSLFSVHLRNEGDEIVEALDEVLDIAKNTEVNLKISHLKIKGKNNWNKFDQITERLDNAYHKGINVHFDVYPYDTVWQPLYSYLPKWATTGGRVLLLKQLKDPVQKNKILMYLGSQHVRFGDLFVASTSSKLNFVGKTLNQIAKNLEITSEAALLNLIENGGSEVLVFEKNLDENQVKNFTAHALSFIATDGAGFKNNVQGKLVHPRCFGTAPKGIELVKQAGGSIEQAIKKLSYGPSQKLGLNKRGSLQIGNFADIVIFDENKFTGKATYQNPYQYSAGMEEVFVNGKAVISEGKFTGNLPGYVLRKK